MTTSQIISWLIVPMILAGLVFVYTLLMLRIETRERMLIKAGLRDKEITSDYKKSKNSSKKAAGIAIRIAEGILFTLLGFFIILAVYGAATGNDFVLFGKQVRIVGSNSMASVHTANQAYVDENGLSERFSTDDLIVIDDLPAESAIQQYDVIAYEDASGRIIIHRVLEIRETATGKQYVMRGDANQSNDPVRITYSDMYGIYGGKVAGVGAFVRFVQSAFGMISIVLCIYLCAAEEFFGARLQKADKTRLQEILDAERRREEEIEKAKVKVVAAEVVKAPSKNARRKSSSKVIEMVIKGRSAHRDADGDETIEYKGNGRSAEQPIPKVQRNAGQGRAGNSRIIVLKRRK